MSAVLWTAEALAKLGGIEAYIADHEKRPGLAKEVVARIIDRTAQLAIAPESGRVHPSYDKPVVRELLARPYRIIYQIKDDQCIVLTVMHYRQLLPDERTLRGTRT